MSAKIIQEGFSTVGFNKAGELVQHEVALEIAEVPGFNGEWCYVIKGNSFCWVKGLEKGFRLYEYPLEGSQDRWQPQIEQYLAAGPKEDDEYTEVAVGERMALAQDRFFIVAE